MLEVIVNDWRYELSFTHDDDPAAVLSDMIVSHGLSVEIPNNGYYGRYRYTIATIKRIDEGLPCGFCEDLCWEGIAVCSHLDQFCKARGRRLSMDRAITAMVGRGSGLTFRPVGKAIRKAYYEKSADFSASIDVSPQPY